MIVNCFSIFCLDWHPTPKMRMKVRLITKDDNFITLRNDLITDKTGNSVTVISQVFVGSEHIKLKEKHKNLLIIIRQNSVHVIWVRSPWLPSIEEMFTGRLQKLAEPPSIMSYV